MLGLLFFISGCEPQNNFYHITGSTMGTSYSVKFGTKKNDFSINLIRWEIDSILIVLNQEIKKLFYKNKLIFYNSRCY